MNEIASARVMPLNLTHGVEGKVQKKNHTAKFGLFDFRVMRIMRREFPSIRSAGQVDIYLLNSNLLI